MTHKLTSAEVTFAELSAPFISIKSMNCCPKCLVTANGIPVECDDESCPCHHTPKNPAKTGQDMGQAVGQDENPAQEKQYIYRDDGFSGMGACDPETKKPPTLFIDGVIAERDRWLNQPANAHDAKIRADERARITRCEIGGCTILAGRFDLHHTKYDGATYYDLQIVCRKCNCAPENTLLV